MVLSTCFESDSEFTAEIAEDVENSILCVLGGLGG
jgi:hypothetical protein